MTKKQAERYNWLTNALEPLGFTREEIDSLLRCSKTLSTWAEHECNGVIQRENEDGTGRPFWHSSYDGRRLGRTADSVFSIVYYRDPPWPRISAELFGAFIVELLRKEVEP